MGFKEVDYSIYIRPMLIKDAQKSFLWEREQCLAKTSSLSSCIDQELELETGWIAYKLEKTTDKCFAICLNFPDRHIGNIELTNIAGQRARCSVLIGEKQMRGKGIASHAIELVAEYAFSYQKLKQLFVELNQDNYAALWAYRKCGFAQDGLSEDGLVVLRLSSESYLANQSKNINHTSTH